MFTYSLRRLLYSIPVLLIASFVVFWGVRTTFDPLAKFAQVRDPEVKAREIKRLSLDRSIPVQWWKWLKGFVTGDWGVSSRTNGSIARDIERSFGTTIQLIIIGVVVATIIAMAIGVFSAVKQYSVPDYLFTGLSYLGVAMPPFWFGLLAIEFLVAWPKRTFDLNEPLFFSIGLHGSGQSGFNVDYLRHVTLPVMTLTVQIIASWSRFQRAAMLDVLGAEYVRTARAKGLNRRTVIVKHALRNALIPLVTVIAVDSGLLFGGLIITEHIFSIPGMGSYFFISLQTGDVYAVMAWMMVAALFVIVFNLLADILYSLLDPRIRLS
ncbi:MAG: ABC transporter permease [Acidimicrobiia bacterium]